MAGVALFAEFEKEIPGQEFGDPESVSGILPVEGPLIEDGKENFLHFTLLFFLAYSSTLLLPEFLFFLFRCRIR